VVLGGPPCSDFSRVNAYRQGIDGAQGQYLERLGKLVTFIQRHELQRGKKVFFLVENVLLSGDDLHRARQAFGVTFGPLEVDAMYVSPCHRRRFFFTNIKQTEDFDYGAKILPETCLEDGYQLGSTYVDPDTIAHCNTFMASLSRIDDERMDIFKKQQQPDGKVRFVKRKINVSEREKMMGYPVGYVSDPINMLYKTCLGAMELDLRSKNTGGRAAWMDKVPPNLHPFAGNYHAHQEGEFFEFEVDMQQNALILKMAPPVARNETVSMLVFVVSHRNAVSNNSLSETIILYINAVCKAPHRKCIQRGCGRTFAQVTFRRLRQTRI
jgi:site-specific DNA-cytosine methylase